MQEEQAMNEQETQYIEVNAEATADEAPNKVFDENDPDTRAALRELVIREFSFFNRHRIHKRADGSYWARLAVQPTEEELTYGCNDLTAGYIHNRGEIVKYFEQNLEKLEKRKLPVCRHSVAVRKDDMTNETFVANLLSPPSDDIMGRLSNLRIRDYGAHKEVHADFKPTKMYAGFDFANATNLCPSSFLMRTEPENYYVDQIKNFNLFYFEKYNTIDDIMEMCKSRWRHTVMKALAK